VAARRPTRYHDPATGRGSTRTWRHRSVPGPLP